MVHEGTPLHDDPEGLHKGGYGDTMTTKVQDGTVLFVDVLEWRESWEFDHPTCILRPVVSYSPNGDSAEEMVESFCETIADRGHVWWNDETGVEDGFVDRLFPLRRLQRRWREAAGGKEFPQKGYEATRWRCRFYEVDDLGEEMLHYEITPTTPDTARAR